ncbi:MAG TPA: hypothetical protein VI796_03300 [Candidatus Thermoplasmatota archaeon]|nr:hypothetical protein [Candidatus Thermoplasmatota archaeon]
MAQEKPAILQETQFTVREGLAYRACRTGAIWMNKLFFASLVLLAVWLLYALVAGEKACGSDPVPVAGGEGDVTDQGTAASCNAFLTPTSLYLGAMAAITFLLSIGFGLLGLVVGKQVLEAAPAGDEVGARRAPEPASASPGGASDGNGDAPELDRNH